MGKVKALWELEQENKKLSRIIELMEEGYDKEYAERLVAEEEEEQGQFGVGA